MNYDKAIIETAKDRRFDVNAERQWQRLLTVGATPKRGADSRERLYIESGAFTSLGQPYFAQGGQLFWAFPVASGERGIIVRQTRDFGDGWLRCVVEGEFTPEEFQAWFNRESID